MGCVVHLVPDNPASWRANNLGHRRSNSCLRDASATVWTNCWCAHRGHWHSQFQLTPLRHVQTTVDASCSVDVAEEVARFPLFFYCRGHFFLAPESRPSASQWLAYHEWQRTSRWWTCHGFGNAETLAAVVARRTTSGESNPNP